MERIPSYRLHKPSGQAVVTLSGRDHYLGTHGTEASRAEYDRLVSLWIASGRKSLKDSESETTINELALAFYRWAEGYYTKGGRATSQVTIIRNALRDLSRLYGRERARDFGPRKLDTLRSHWVNDGIGRSLANRRCRIVKQCFRWAAERELVPGPTWQSVASLKPLARGRTQAHETPGVQPVPLETVEATRLHLCSFAAAMVQLQLLTGMRPGEVIAMRAKDIDRSAPVWTYTPPGHKTEHRGKGRTIFLGPRSQAILGPFLETTSKDSPIFVTPKRRRRWQDDTYQSAIRKAAVKAGVPHWHPSQLRHTYATAVRASEGLDAARLMLGHSQVETTQIYAESDMRKARDIAARLG